ncbi:hypothetical protein RRG08_026121 [Elysia crispata]|uniref:EGF-like domain-containing protein n=1 Tax=Elysia crispata TaxID=231223 RepID=A0AAE1D3A4_9GAST|nr:hypothetical protein RRG08_026121 [Elysia crispata]
MIVEDVPIDTINMGGFIYQGKMDTLGQTQVQFLIQTLANLTNPEFVAPTPCVNGTEAHVPSYYMYSGTTLRLPLHAQASTENFVDVDIERFHITSMPIQNLSLAPPTPAPGRPLTDNVWMTQLSWKLDVHESAHYLLQAIAVDTRGFDSLDCSFDVQVEVVNYTKQPSKVGPYFPYFPDPGAVSCLQDAICSLPIYANTDDPTANITNIEITSSSAELGNPTALWVGPSTFMNESLYQADITFSSSQTGDKQLCVRATDSYGQPVENCLQVTMFGPDPCSVELDVCGKYGICHVNTTDPSTFYCECFIGMGGQFCEKEINPCDFDYCIRGVQCIYQPDILTVPICLGCQPQDDCITSKYCKPHPCGDHGSCIPLLTIKSHKCDCDPGYTGSTIACVNGGQMFYTGSVPACHCPLGFSGVFCAVEDPDSVLQPKYTDLLSPPKGATIYCEMSQPCDFPVYPQGPSNNTVSPNITEGPKSPDITVAVGPSVPSNATSLPGQVFQTPITTTSQTPGSKQLCLWLNQHNATSRCFNIIFQVPSIGSTVTPTVNQPHFLHPTPCQHYCALCQCEWMSLCGSDHTGPLRTMRRCVQSTGQCNCVRFISYT